MKSLLLFIKILEKVSPRLAVKFCARLFATPKKHQRPSHEAEVISSAESFEFECGLKAHKFGRSGPPVLLVHGWEGRGSQLAYFAKPLVDLGYCVYAVDGPGHGESPGKQTTPVHFARFMMSVADELGPLKGLIAHSFGAGCATLAVHDGLETESLVLIASPDRYARVVGFFCEQVGFKPETRELFFKHVTQRVGMRPESLQISNLAKRLKARLMIVHDRNDKAVPFDASEKIHAAVPGSTFLITAGLGHRRILKDPGVLQAVSQFIAR